MEPDQLIDLGDGLWMHVVRVEGGYRRDVYLQEEELAPPLLIDRRTISNAAPLAPPMGGF